MPSTDSDESKNKQVNNTPNSSDETEIRKLLNIQGKVAEPFVSNNSLCYMNDDNFLFVNDLSFKIIINA